VIPDKLIPYYESLVGRRRMPVDESPHIRNYVAEIRDAWEARVILRDLRNRAGIATCSGEVDCLEKPTSRCMRREHPTCSNHTDICYLCMPLGHLEYTLSHSELFIPSWRSFPTSTAIGAAKESQGTRVRKARSGL
jgi:hypothetical protein